MPSKEGKRLKGKVMPLIDSVEADDWADEWELVSAALPLPLPLPTTH